MFVYKYSRSVVLCRLLTADSVSAADKLTFPPQSSLTNVLPDYFLSLISYQQFVDHTNSAVPACNNRHAIFIEIIKTENTHMSG